MIIQCKQCRTKFRFDESQMEGDGLWMRCSRCRHVFFQESPAKPGPVAGETAAGMTSARLSFEPAVPARIAADKERDPDEASLRRKVEPEEPAGGSLPPEPEPEPSERVGLNLTDIEFSPGEEIAPEAEEAAAAAVEPPPAPEKKKSKAWLAVLWSVLVIIVIPAVLLFFVFPQQLERYVEIGRKYLGASQPYQGHSVLAQVKVQEIRQRVVNNYILGNIRVVEGVAVNQADFAVARIQVKAAILDAYAVVLDERTSFAGNILSDEELTNASEEDMLKILSLPEGRDNSNERVIPGGRIPFMIVFTREQPGVIKTTVTIAGAERLL
ncbi:MAG: DUF3426 domain-containing protein [Smithellaceae bacterium]|nr:zinc-ribbon domain-containing protein [Syntrophaceae bacterium]MDD4240356.1 DUF3426 domain-containing protein [Smithellaceae bacterium]NLX52139.1 DUF3426 domain-containing protein [Deltaproteobacteria bacterium]